MVGGLPGRILAPGTPLLTPRVPLVFIPFFTHLLTPLLAPLVTSLPLVVTPASLVISIVPIVVPLGAPVIDLSLLPGLEMNNGHLVHIRQRRAIF